MLYPGQIKKWYLASAHFRGITALVVQLAAQPAYGQICPAVSPFSFCLSCRHNITIVLFLRFVYVLLSLLFAGFSAAGQYPLLRHYTLQDGLPSNVIYDVYQDSKGFIWFCTDQGVSRFDGSEFRNFSIKDGLPDTEVFRIREDGAHRYWLISYNEKACYLKNGKVYTAANDALCRSVEQAGIHYDELFQARSGNYCLAGERIGELLDEPPYLRLWPRDVVRDGRVNYFRKHDAEYMVVQVDLVNLTTGKVYKVSKSLIPESYYDGRDLFLFQNTLQELLLEQWDIGRDTVSRRKVVTAPAVIHQMIRVDDDRLLCSTDSSLYDYHIPSGVFKRDTMFPRHIRANKMQLDKDGNFWLGTLNDGVYCRPVNGGRIVNEQSGLIKNKILSLELASDDGLLAGDDAGNISLIRKGKIAFRSGVRAGTANRILFIRELEPGHFIFGGDQGLYRSDWRQNAASLSLDLFSCKGGIWRPPFFYSGYIGGMSVLNTVTGVLNRIECGKITAIEMDAAGIIWQGRTSGLTYSKNNHQYVYGPDPVLNQNRVTCMALSPDGYVLVGTSSAGLFIVKDPRQLPLHLDRNSGLSSNNCKKMFTAGDGCIWLCSEDGLDRLRPVGNGRFSINHFPLYGPVSGNKINDLRERDGKLYLATDDGIVILDSRDTAATKPPRLYIEAINNRVFTEPEKNVIREFSYQERNVQVSYTGVCFTTVADLQYRYLLNGGTKDTLYTSERTINFSALSPGIYELYLWARSTGSNWTERPVRLAFRILPPFWMRGDFLAAVALAVLFTTILLYRARIRKIKRRAAALAQSRQQLAELEMKALRAQINPHFIFNALNAIQSYYSQNDELKANHYMTSFARFIRLTLTHSQSHWLALSEEIAMLRTYIELEQMRFKQLFTFEIVVGPGINPTEVAVPAMLIQPYVENAINHGLRYLSDRKGVLLVRFALLGDNLLCEVDDNGVGMKASAAGKPMQHNSLGMKINRERIDTICRMYDIRIVLNVTEKDAVQTGDHGTLISLLVPLRKNVQPC